MERGRYTSYSTHKTPHRRKNIRLSGSFEEKNKWIRCWNCGFIVNTERDLGDPEHSGVLITDTGVSVTDAIVEAQTLCMGGSDPRGSIDTLNGVGTMIMNDASGTAITDYYTPRLASAIRGCKFCGCTNL